MPGAASALLDFQIIFIMSDTELRMLLVAARSVAEPTEAGIVFERPAQGNLARILTFTRLVPLSVLV